MAGDEADERRNYRAEVVPWLWFLTQTADCRIFQEKKVGDIIRQIFSDLGFSDFRMDLQLDHKKWEYCVQYRETDFNFVSRLMEQEGIFYFFVHEDGKHTMVLADHKGAYVDCKEATADFPLSLGQHDVQDHLTSWQHAYEFRPGKFAQMDFNFETPSTSLMTKTNSLVKMPGMDKFEVYDYPGEYAQKNFGDVETKVRMEEEEAAHDVVQGAGRLKTFTPGGKFTVGVHRSKTEEGKPFVITSVQHVAQEPLAYETGGGQMAEEYRNTFHCIPATVVFRPARTTRKPLVSGVQTAIVTGPAGEEIHTDKYGRVKIQFHWDREGKKDENTSCWTRVSQVHASKNFGGIDIPRIGDEVIVDFLEGDPDRPIIVGRVYHAENMPPFGLPGAKNISGLKSNSTKGGGGYNEYVLDDTKGNELIREHGQFDKDSTIEHDLREHVLHDRTRDVTNNETITIGVNRTESVGKDESLTVGANRTETVGINETLSVGADRSRSVGGNESVTVAMLRTHTVGINEAITVGAAQEISVGAMQAITVGAMQTITVGASQTVTVGSNQTNTVGKNLTEQVAANREASIGKDDKLQVGKNLVVEAGDSIAFKTGKASILMKKDGTIQIKGKDISITGSGKITAKASKDMTLKGQKILEN